MERLAEIHDALLGAGFTSQFTNGGNRYYGNLHCRGTDYPIWVEIPDPEFKKHPKIYLVERPQSLTDVCAHIGATNDICYSTQNIDVLDIYNPGAAALGCVKAAERVLCEALYSDTLAETQAEFHSYWQAKKMLLAEISPNTPDGWLDLYNITRPNGEFAFCLASTSPTSFERSGYSAEKGAAGVYVVSLEQLPAARATNWPPKTLGQLTDWLKAVEGGLPYKAFVTALRKRQGKSCDFVFLARTPGSWWAVQIHEDRLAKKAYHQDGGRWVKHVLKVGGNWEITRFLVERVDADHLVKRNLADRKGLGRKRILLIGCGTIGGYLANLLARVGAGSAGGKLVLCDNQDLRPGNIGRHYLGVDQLLEPKAVALASRLTAALPHAQIIGINDDAMKLDLKGYDCIIDATGSEPLSQELNERLVLMGNKIPALYIWNEGGGIASQCLFVDSPKAACYRCLSDEKLHPRFSPLKDPTVDTFVMGTGCDTAYVPYPAVVSVQAASMACNLLLDWVDGHQVKKFQTITHDSKLGKTINDTTPAKHSRCPACSKR